MNTYVDMLMSNHKLVSNSSDEMSETYESVLISQKGGDPNNENDKLKYIATGSFPPIYIMTAEEKKEEEKIEKTRGFTVQKTAVSIKEIMQERRDDKKPFVIL